MAAEEKVVYPPLTPVTSDAQVRGTLNRVIEALSPLVGQHKVKANQAVTWLDLVTAGYQFEFTGEGDFVLEPPYQPEKPDMAVPPAIINFEAVASFNYVTFSWGQPKYKNHSHVEIWRAEGFKTVGSGPNIPTVVGDAVFRLMAPSIMASDTVLPADVWRYWARNVSKTGVVGAWTSVDGLLINVPESPAYLIDKISGEIRQSDLYVDLGQKIDDSYNGVVSLVELTNESYTVRIDTGGAVHGFGLMADPETGRSDFIVRADRFAIAAPQQYDQNGEPIITDAALPFIVDVIDPLNPKVLIKNAYIDKAYIESLVTGSLIADKIVGQTIQGTHIRGGDIAIGANFTVDTAGSATMLNAFFKGTAQSSNFATGVSGWQIRNDGYAELRQAVVRGTVYADSGYFNGIIYAEKMVGGLYSQKPYNSVASPMSDSTSFRTAFSFSVTRGMAVSRSLQIDGPVANISVTAIGNELNGYGGATFEVRVLRDGGEVFTGRQRIVASPPYTGPTGGGSADTVNSLLMLDAIVQVPSDSAAHAYSVQYRLVSTDSSSNAIVSVTGTSGVLSPLRSMGRLYIENGDLS